MGSILELKSLATKVRSIDKRSLQPAEDQVDDFVARAFERFNLPGDVADTLVAGAQAGLQQL